MKLCRYFFVNVTFICYNFVDCVWNVMAHVQKPDFVFQRNGWVHLNWRGRQFSRLLAADVCKSAIVMVVMLDTPFSEVVWRVLATHSIRQFPLHFPSRASPCAIIFQLDYNTSLPCTPILSDSTTKVHSIQGQNDLFTHSNMFWPIGNLQGYHFKQNLLNLSFHNPALEDSNPMTRKLAFYQKKASSVKQTDLRDMLKKACKSFFFFFYIRATVHCNKFLYNKTN
jgi:hypothetical protein